MANTLRRPGVLAGRRRQPVELALQEALMRWFSGTNGFVYRFRPVISVRSPKQRCQVEHARYLRRRRPGHVDSRTSQLQDWSDKSFEAASRRAGRTEAAAREFPFERLRRSSSGLVVDLELCVAGAPGTRIVLTMCACRRTPRGAPRGGLRAAEPSRVVRRSPPRGRASVTLLGTLTRAENSWPPSGSRATTARFKRESEI